jgi:hypothetical protein
VAIINGRVAGHISIIAPHPYLTDALAGLGQGGAVRHTKDHA